MGLFNFFGTKAYIIRNDAERKYEIKEKKTGILFGYALMDDSISEIKSNIRSIERMFSLKITNKKSIFTE